MRTVKEISGLTGVSVRALHYYDSIGLLKPAKVTEAGYRLYDDAALARLQTILLFRELQFPLKEIKAILDSPDFDPSEALAQQIRLLELQYQHIGELISFAREIQEKGVGNMNFQAFDTKKVEAYRAEVKERWGSTREYREYKQRGEKAGNSDSAAGQLTRLFSEFGELRQLPPDDRKVQEKVDTLQKFITEHYYTCSDSVLYELGQMYVYDERFRRNIDQAGGEGTAELVKRAIELHCAC